jgi:hypothetical protein
VRDREIRTDDPTHTSDLPDERQKRKGRGEIRSPVLGNPRRDRWAVFIEARILGSVEAMGFREGVGAAVAVRPCSGR